MKRILEEVLDEEKGVLSDKKQNGFCTLETVSFSLFLLALFQ